MSDKTITINLTFLADPLYDNMELTPTALLAVQTTTQQACGELTPTVVVTPEQRDHLLIMLLDTIGWVPYNYVEPVWNGIRITTAVPEPVAA